MTRTQTYPSRLNGRCGTSVAPTLWGFVAAAGLTVLLGCADPDLSVETETGGKAASLTPLSLDAVFGSARGVGRAVISPDGGMLAVVGEHRGVAGVHLVDLDATNGAKHVASGGQPSWSPDGSRLAYVDSGALMVAEVSGTGSSAEDPVDPGLGPAVVVARAGDGMSSLRSPAWAPDSQRIAFFAHSAESPAAAGPSVGEGAQDIFVVPADGASEPVRLTTGAAEGEDGRFVPSWSPDGQTIAYVSLEANWWHDDVWIVDVATGAKSQVSETLMASSSPIWSPDGEHLVLMGTSKSEYWYQDLAYLYRIDLAPRASAALPRKVGEREISMQVFASDYIMRFDPFWSADSGTVFFPYHERGAFDLWSVPAVGGVATRVSHLGGAWTSLDATPDGSRAVFVRDAPTEGREAWTLDTAGSLPVRATQFTPGLEGVQRPIEVSFRSFDGLFIQGFLYLPPQLRADVMAGRAAETSCPSLVQVHGGGTNSTYQGTNLVEQYLASRGFVVLAINYRGGSGFGREFQDLAIEDWLNGQSKDPGSAADWLRAQAWANGKVGIYGGSYGGMQSMSAITRTPDKFDAAVPMRGIYSEALTLADSDRLGRIFTITGHGGTPEERPEIYLKTETLARMDRITAPVLVMHGERDVRAPFKNFELAVDRLEELGKEYEAKSYPEGHGFRDPANLADMYGRLEAFFSKHLGACGQTGLAANN